MDGSAEPSLVTYERRGDVAVIGLNRPDKRNAVSDRVVEALAEAVIRASDEAKYVTGVALDVDGGLTRRFV